MCWRLWAIPQARSPRTPTRSTVRRQSQPGLCAENVDAADSGQFAAALQDLSDARSFGWADAKVAFLEGQAYHSLQRPEKAVNALKQAIELDNRNAYRRPRSS